MKLLKHAFSRDSTIDDLEPFKEVGKANLTNKVFSLDVALSSNTGDALMLLG